MLSRRPLLLVIACLCTLPSLRAHFPGESSLVIARDAEALELRLVISLPSASALLGAEPTPPLSPESFDQHRPAFLAAAAKGCQLLDPEGAALVPDRILASIHEGHEVRIDFFFPPSVRPSRLRLPILSSLVSGAWCEVTDLRDPASARATLSAKSAELSLVK
jgi:hypothetical protein